MMTLLRCHHPLLTLLLGLVLLASPTVVCGAEAPLQPLTVSNQSPLVQGFGLPAQLDAVLLPAGQWQGDLRFDWASNYTSSANSREEILLDGESQRYTLAVRTGLPGGWELGLEVPWVRFSGGSLDSFIEDWHDTFGLPQGGRDSAPNNRLTFRYVRDGATLLDFTESTEGLGDIALSCAWQARRDEHPVRTALALGSRLKLPTGDGQKLLGSGSTDLALWLAGQAATDSGTGAWAAYFAFGGLAMSQGDIIADQQQPLAAFGRFGLGWSPAAFIAFKLQLDANSPLYKESDLQELGSAVVLNMGGTLLLPAALRLDLAVAEDLIVGASPDVAFHLALGRRF